MPEPLSPELVPVAPDEEAQRAREELSDASTWNDFLAEVRSRPGPSVDDEEVRAEPWEEPTRRSRPRLVPILLVVLVMALIAGGAALWARNRSHGTVPPSAAKPAPGSTSVPAKRTRVQSTVRSPRARHAKPAAPETTPRKARATQGAVVPARVFSWAAAPGSRYRVRFFRDGRKVLDVRSGTPRLVLPRTFAFGPGRYRWMVVAISRAGARHVVVNSSFVVGKS